MCVCEGQNICMYFDQYRANKIHNIHTFMANVQKNKITIEKIQRKIEKKREKKEAKQRVEKEM